MSVQGIAKHVRLYARTEAMVAEIRMRAYGRKVALAIVAMFSAVMGLAFLNVAAYAFLQSLWGPVWTPLAIGLANFLFAGAALLASLNAQSGPELETAKELRKLSADTLEAEFQTPQAIGGLLGAVGTGGQSTVTHLLLPAIMMITRAMAQRKAASKKT